MFTIEFIAPYKHLVSAVEEAFSEHPKRNEIKHVVNFKGVPEIRRSRLVGDIFIARGLTASYLHQLWKDATVIEVPMSGYDILRAMNEGVKKFDSKRIALIATTNAVYGVANFSTSFLPPVMTYEIGPLDDVKPQIEQAIADGADLIIGGNSVYLTAKSMGMPAQRIEVGKESVRQAIDEAWRIWHSNIEERVRVQRLNALVANVHEGIITVDQNKRITVCNQFAEQMLHCSDDVINRKLSEVVPQLEDPDIIDLKQPGIGEFVEINGIQIVVNKIPVLVEGKFQAGIITLQEVSQIQKIETRIRREAHRKGLVATYDFSQMIGESRILLATKKLALGYAKVQSNVLLVGETGTGKELFAQSIHRASERCNRPFVAVNCAALPESLLESELFGYVGGSFTGASKTGKMGLFELAHTGTIFLDEISEMSLHLQGRLLRVIEEREIMRIGHDTVIPVDIRIIAATNRSLEELVEKNLFRKDLFYRLDVLRLNIPPLRKRKDDIFLLTKHFLIQYDELNGRSHHMLDPEVIPILKHLTWDGNIRQLRNVCERLSVVVSGTVIKSKDLLTCLGRVDDLKNSGAEYREDEEKQKILEVLSELKQNKAEAARHLGIDRSTLYRKLKKYGLA
ncbi:sigma 54-interacting transcriptional regulator [uncultured Sphaerochaeta sp.]|uniref:sigma 54-interacting transcriptional regulator n=1 Tax=uncultured Sphaerochaeta sp. TaxID=886478 RepID=UPI002A0A38A7|nr:sigma 54-interacting transcriptional regulator [uncultured Sphaerochaeta sp.]